jgi:hypothetical protein
MEDPNAQPLHQDLSDLDLEILDMLREDNQSAQLLAETLSQEGEQAGVDKVRRRLQELATGGLARPIEKAAHRAESGAAEPVLGDRSGLLWEITDEGRALVEPHIGVARAPYDRGVSNDEGGDERDVAGLVVLLLIALLTGACAAYSLLTAAGVLGG